MHLIRCALFAAAASALAPPSVSVRAPISLKAVLQDSTIAVDERSFAGDKTLPTLCETVATPGVQWCADVISSLAAAPKTFEFLCVSPIMPRHQHLQSATGSGLDVYGQVDPKAQSLVDSIKQRNEVRGADAMEQMLQDVSAVTFVKQLEYADQYQGVPQGNVNDFLDHIFPDTLAAVKQAPDILAAAHAFGGTTHQGTSLESRS